MKVFTVLIYYDMGVRLSWALGFFFFGFGEYQDGLWEIDLGILGQGSRKQAEEKLGNFIRTYNRIRRFDYVLIQIAKTGEIHAMAVVKDRYYDDQTPIWKAELEQRRVLFPWRVPFCFIIYSEKPILRRFIEIQNYIDGYGLGEIMDRDIVDIVKAAEEK